MKKIAAVAILILIGVLIGRAAEWRPKRFEEIYSQVMPPTQGDNNAASTTFRVFHDTETGQEVVCLEGAVNRWNRVDSCYLTGRSWPERIPANPQK